MRFDVIVGNPPYQINDGGGGQKASASPIYYLFIQKCILLNHIYLVLITPSKWFVGGKVQKDIREKMLDDRHYKEMIDYVNSKDCFNDIDLPGGINYFLRDACYNGECHILTIYNSRVVESYRYLREKGFEIFVRPPCGITIIKKVKSNTSFNKIVSERNPFYFPTSFRGREFGDVKIFHSEGYGYIEISEIIRIV